MFVEIFSQKVKSVPFTINRKLSKIVRTKSNTDLQIELAPEKCETYRFQERRHVLRIRARIDVEQYTSADRIVFLPIDADQSKTDKESEKEFDHLVSMLHRWLNLFSSRVEDVLTVYTRQRLARAKCMRSRDVLSFETKELLKWLGNQNFATESCDSEDDSKSVDENQNCNACKNSEVDMSAWWNCRSCRSQVDLEDVTENNNRIYRRQNLSGSTAQTDCSKEHSDENANLTKDIPSKLLKGITFFDPAAAELASSYTTDIVQDDTADASKLIQLLRKLSEEDNLTETILRRSLIIRKYLRCYPVTVTCYAVKQILQLSSDAKKICYICKQTFIKSKTFDGRLFGLLRNCRHIFCYHCIKNVMDPDGLLSQTWGPVKCPECWVVSSTVAASQYWIENDMEKEQFFEVFECNMSLLPSDHLEISSDSEDPPVR